MKSFILIGITCFMLISCSKHEGEGGESTITGRVVEQTYDESFKVLQSKLPAVKKDVYITYGGNGSVDDKVETNYDGIFEFNYLQKGNYTIFYYSEDKTRKTIEKIPIVVNVNIGSDGDTQSLGDLMTDKSIKIDDGTATITGKIIVHNYKADFTELKDVGPAQEQEVYLVYENHLADDIRVRTNYMGVYEFKNLIKGNYFIYAYSDDRSGATEKLVASRNVVITKDLQVEVMSDMHIDKK